MSPDGTSEPAARKPGRNRVDMIVAFSALFVSVVSLGVAIRMADANTRLVSASSWPFLSYGAGVATTNGTARIHMNVANAGVGPAKIESAELVWKGVAYASDPDFLKACCGRDAAAKPDFDSDLLTNEVRAAEGALRSGCFRGKAVGRRKNGSVRLKADTPGDATSILQAI